MINRALFSTQKKKIESELEEVLEGSDRRWIIIDYAKLKVLEGCGTWAEWIWRSILARHLRCSFTRCFESNSLIFFRAIFVFCFSFFLWFSKDRRRICVRNINIALFLREKEIEMEELNWMGSRWLLVNWLGWWQPKKTIGIEERP